MSSFETVKIFNQPIIKVTNGTTMADEFEFIVKLETTYSLEHAITVSFTYTDGKYEELLKQVTLKAPEPKKQRFTAIVPTPNYTKTPLGGLLNGSAILVDFLYNGQVLSRVPVHMVVEDTTGELKASEVEEESFMAEEEQPETDAEAIEEAFGGEESDFERKMLVLVR